MVSRSVRPLNQTPEAASSLESSTVPSSETSASEAFTLPPSRPLKAADVSIMPFSSVTSTWLSPVLVELSEKATFAMRSWLSSSALTSLRSARFTWSGRASAASVTSTVTPSSRTRMVLDQSLSRRYPVGAFVSRSV